MSEKSLQNHTGTLWSVDQLDRLIKEIPEVAAAHEYGVDLPMLLDNMNRSVAERIRRHQIAFNTFQMLRNAKKL